MELLAFTSRQFAPISGPLSAIIFRANELSGREKSEAPCASIRWLSIRLSLVAPNSITRFDAAFLPTMVSMYPVT